MEIAMQIYRRFKSRVDMEEVPVKRPQIEGKTEEEIDEIYASMIEQRMKINTHRRAQLEYIEGFIANNSKSPIDPQSP